ncbi:TatD family hydrolase [Thalassolituus sp. LLYu03]|uniref:TatD family hydrolase n=1 Tax=Thalassolituus sp. LLYu03 TaxID=3421656 RepID=UPI003D2BF34E
MNDAPHSWFDSHCHFDFEAFAPDREQVWECASGAGVAGLLIPGVTARQNARLPDFCAGRPWWFGLGLHPYFLSEHQPTDLEWLDQTLASSAAVAVGEIGLDRVLATDHDLLEAQWFWFREQVALAQRHNKPLILHIRGMHDEAVAYLRRVHFSGGGLVHAFSGSEQQGWRWRELGFALGVGGAMTHARATRLRTTLRRLPLDCLLLETDSPDMVPAWWGSARNSPQAIPLLAASLAALHQINLSELSDLLGRNRQRFLGV